MPKPPPKDVSVMGVRLSRVPDDAPQRPRARPTEPVRVVEEVPALPEPPPSMRSFSPPGNVKFAGPYGTSFSGPGIIFLLVVLIVGVLVGVVWFAQRAVERLEARIDALDDRLKTRDEAKDRRIAALELEVLAGKERERHNLQLMGAVVNKLGSNVRFDDGTRPQAEFHPAPLSPRSAPVQPRDTLIAP